MPCLYGTHLPYVFISRLSAIWTLSVDAIEHFQWHSGIPLPKVPKNASITSYDRFTPNIHYIRALEPHGGQELIWAFIDGTFRGFCRPDVYQRMYYLGHKKRHGSKWQTMLTPDGLISHFDGPYKDSVNDALMLHESPLETHLEYLMKDLPAEEKYYIFGDQVYSYNHTILAPYPDNNLLPRQRKFNKSIQKCVYRSKTALVWYRTCEQRTLLHLSSKIVFSLFLHIISCLFY